MGTRAARREVLAAPATPATIVRPHAPRQQRAVVLRGCCEAVRPGLVVEPRRAAAPGTHAALTRAYRLASLRPSAGADGGIMDAPSLSKQLNTAAGKQKSPNYNVLLHNDPYNKREYVVKVLMKVIDGFGMNDAMRVMTEAHENGVSVVVTVPQSDAEEYCESLRTNGLNASMRPS